jgi:protein TonB
VVSAASLARRAPSESVSFVSLVTLVLWCGLIAAGALGFVLAPAPPMVTSPAPPPVQAEWLNVELTSDPVVIPETSAPPPSEPPPMPELLTEPPVATLTAVAAPDALVSFALPVEGPVRIVETARASFAKPAADAPPVVAARPVVQALTFGEGDGRQKAPEYPRLARRERQEGAPRVRFTVGQNGRVLEAALSSPSPWPLLNEAALKVIREHWQFRPGAVRAYEVTIRFEMNRR